MSLEGTINHLLDNRREDQVLEDRSTTFSIRMSETDHQLLNFLADYVGMKKTPFADLLLHEAMQDMLRAIARNRAEDESRESREKAFFEVLDEVDRHRKDAS